MKQKKKTSEAHEKRPLFTGNGVKDASVSEVEKLSEAAKFLHSLLKKKK